MEQFLYNVAIYVFEMLIAFVFFSHIYKKRIKTIWVILIGTVIFVASSVIFVVIKNPALNLLLFFLINFVFSLLCFEIKIKESIIFSIILDAIMFSSETLTIYVSSSLFKLPAATFKNDFEAYIILSSISKVLYLVISQFIVFIIKKDNHTTTKSKRFLPLFIFPTLTIASLFIFLIIDTEVEFSQKYKIAIAVISILYIFSCVFILIYYQLLIDNEVKVVELESEKRLYNLNETYLNVLEHQNNELQMMFHDTKHHYMVLDNFDSISEVKTYISKLYKELEQKNIIRISNNKMLDLIISKYIVVCKNNDIKLTCEVKTANLNYIDDSDLSIILNNVLDNAVEAAKDSTEKFIDLSIRCVNNMDVLSVINSCDKPPKHDNDQLITTKMDSNKHGFGTKIIKKQVKKNNGQYEWSYNEEKHRFQLTILFEKATQIN